MIDTHAHIYSDQFDLDREKTIERAKKVGVSKILMPNIDHTSIDQMMECEEKHLDYCLAMMGLHPCSVKKDFEKELYIVEEWLDKRPFIAIGEIGLDLHWDKTFFEEQKEAFRVQIDFAKKFKIPIAIHAREATSEILAILEKEKTDELKGVFHCFGGSLDEANAIINLDFKLGIGGVSTFKKGGLDNILPELDLEHLILETDCPYLAPVPHRGKRNEPAYLDLIAERISDLMQIPKSEVVSKTSATTNSLFSL